MNVKCFKFCKNDREGVNEWLHQESFYIWQNFRTLAFKEARARNAVSKNLFLWRISVSHCHSRTFPREDSLRNTREHICKLPCTTTFFYCVCSEVLHCKNLRLWTFLWGKERILISLWYHVLLVVPSFFFFLATTTISSIWRKKKNSSIKETQESTV